jgi:hypothetical protein
MTCLDVYLLAAHELYDDPRYPRPINALVVHALTLLHRDVPQPDGGMMFRCLTEFPHRHPGQLVPVSTLTYELDGGRLWPLIGDWEAVTDALLALSRAQQCNAVAMSLTDATSAIITASPVGETILYHYGGGIERCGPDRRQTELDELAGQVHTAAAGAQLLPESRDLVPPPTNPATMPYQPYRAAPR